MQSTPTQTSNPRRIRFGIFEADLTAGELRKGGSRIRLQEQPFQILAMLLERPGSDHHAGGLAQQTLARRHFRRFRTWGELGCRPASRRVGRFGGQPALYRDVAAAWLSPDRLRRGAQPPQLRPTAAVNGSGSSLSKCASCYAGWPRPAAPQVVAPSSGATRLRRRRSLAAGHFAAVVLELRLDTSYYLRPAHALTETDSIVLADFTNSTSDPVFDNTLRQALEVKLIDSPFLNIVPEDRMRDTLRFMGRSPDERLTTANAREVCQRLSSKAMLSGSITQLDDHYSILLAGDQLRYRRFTGPCRCRSRRQGRRTQGA